jgi:hypothetical protein
MNRLLFFWREKGVENVPPSERTTSPRFIVDDVKFSEIYDVDSHMGGESQRKEWR